MSAVRTVAVGAGRRATRKVRRWTIGLLVLAVLGVALAVGVERGIEAAASETRQAVTDAVTPDWSPVVDTRDQLAEWVDALPPPVLIEQRARELVGADDG